MPDTIAIVDYGLGNLFNLQRAFSSFGAKTTITRDKAEIGDASKMILPGVGAFEAGMKNIEKFKLIEVIRDFAASGRPVLGICLGMQLLLSRSHENGRWDGLGLIEGDVLPLDRTEDIKVPHIGWNSLLRPKNNGRKKDAWAGSLLEGLQGEPYMYFLHSYYAAPKDSATVVAQTRYGKNLFCSAVRKNNIAGCQFHPERSSEAGLAILKTFAKDKECAKATR